MMRMLWMLLHAGKNHEQKDLTYDGPLGLVPPDDYFDVLVCRRCGRRFVVPSPFPPPKIRITFDNGL